MNLHSLALCYNELSYIPFSLFRSSNSCISLSILETFQHYSSKNKKTLIFYGRKGTWQAFLFVRWFLSSYSSIELLLTTRNYYDLLLWIYLFFYLQQHTRQHNFKMPDYNQLLSLKWQSNFHIDSCLEMDQEVRIKKITNISRYWESKMPKLRRLD